MSIEQIQEILGYKTKITNNLEKLLSLRDRVSKLSGPTNDPYIIADLTEVIIGRVWVMKDEEAECVGAIAAAAVRSGSVDAVENLRRRSLPGWFVWNSCDCRSRIVYAKDKHIHQCWRCEMQHEDGGRQVSAKAPTEPLARLLALLNVMVECSQQERDR